MEGVAISDVVMSSSDLDLKILPQITKLVKKIGYMAFINCLHAVVHLISFINSVFVMPLLDLFPHLA
jgi:hypothetical protein